MYNQSIRWETRGTVMVGRFNAPRSPLEITATLSQSASGRWQWCVDNPAVGLSTKGQYRDRAAALEACEHEAKAITTRACQILSDREINRRRRHEREA